LRCGCSWIAFQSHTRRGADREWRKHVSSDTRRITGIP